MNDAVVQHIAHRVVRQDIYAQVPYSDVSGQSGYTARIARSIHDQVILWTLWHLSVSSASRQTSTFRCHPRCMPAKPNNPLAICVVIRRRISVRLPVDDRPYGSPGAANTVTITKHTDLSRAKEWHWEPFLSTRKQYVHTVTDFQQPVQMQRFYDLVFLSFRIQPSTILDLHRSCTHIFMFFLCFISPCCGRTDTRVPRMSVQRNNSSSRSRRQNLRLADLNDTWMMYHFVAHRLNHRKLRRTMCVSCVFENTAKSQPLRVEIRCVQASVVDAGDRHVHGRGYQRRTATCRCSRAQRTRCPRRFPVVRDEGEADCTDQRTPTAKDTRQSSRAWWKQLCVSWCSKKIVRRAVLCVHTWFRSMTSKQSNGVGTNQSLRRINPLVFYHMDPLDASLGPSVWPSTLQLNRSRVVHVSLVPMVSRHWC